MLFQVMPGEREFLSKAARRSENHACGAHRQLTQNRNHGWLRGDVNNSPAPLAGDGVNGSIAGPSCAKVSLARASEALELVSCDVPFFPPMPELIARLT
jgi:hypothetical protein